MALPSVETSFVKQWEKDVHVAFQRKGSKLRERVRTKNNIKGASTTFQTYGKGSAGTKARHGLVPVMNPEHGSVECVLADYYGASYVDKLDELKTNNDERQLAVNAGAFALGRKTDELIIAALDGSTNYAGDDGATGLTLDKIMLGYEALGNADVPDDGERTAVVGLRQWTQLLQIDEFANADYVGGEDLVYKGISAKMWLGTLWMSFPALTISSSKRKCHWFHKSAIGHASGLDVTTDISWIAERAAHLCNNMMSQGAVMIDATGVVTLRCLES